MGSDNRFYKRVRAAMILRAKTPIAHHFTTYGNVSIVQTETIRQPDGRYVEVPKITGDALRHGLRHHGAMVFLDAAGLLENPSLSTAALRLLFSGGSITGPSGASVPLAEYRRLAELIPPLGLLGGCADNRMMPGKIEVESAIMLCDEATPALSAWTLAWMDDHKYVTGKARRAIILEKRVRMDPTLAASTKALLEPKQLALIEANLDRRAVAVTDDEIRASKSSMMPREFEVVAAGSHFQWAIHANLHSALERDTLYLMLAAFLSDMHVGGKQGVGHGQLECIVGTEFEVYRPMERAGLVLPSLATVGSLFRDHVSAHATEIKDLLDKVVS